MDKFLKDTNITQPGYIASQVVLIAATSGFVAIRLWSNYNYAGRFFADDCE
jgi:hypothetical protein